MPATSATALLRAYERHQHTVPGWLDPLDLHLFGVIHAAQIGSGVAGDVLEIGAYRGRSAIALGYLVRPGERLVVCDLFEDPPVDTGNVRESTRYYHDLTRDQFERNYLRFHPALPEIVQRSSTELLDAGLAPIFRIVHVDGCHIHDVVRQDVRTARALAVEGGVAVFDDYRNAALPGVAAAVWEAVATLDLRPLAVTPTKLYATWGEDPTGLRPAVVAAMRARPGWVVEDDEIFGHDVHPVTWPASRLARVGNLVRRVRW